MKNAEERNRTINNAARLLETAHEIWMSEVNIQIAGEAIEPLIDVCRKLLSTVQDQQNQIDELNKTIRNRLSDVV